jgi:hypothetical protein
MFEDALMESSNGIKTKSKYWSILALAINCGVLIALIIWPLWHPEALPRADHGYAAGCAASPTTAAAAGASTKNAGSVRATRQ